jgi:predicted nucleic acid-binding protein
VPAELFVDSSAWYPIARSGHPDHAALAAQLRARIAAGARIVTTNLVLAESHALILARAGSAAALRFLTEVRSPPNEIVSSDADIEARAIGVWLNTYADHAFSLTDAVSFEVIKSRRIRDVLTLDKHFVVAGFTIARHE